MEIFGYTGRKKKIKYIYIYIYKTLEELLISMNFFSYIFIEL